MVYRAVIYFVGKHCCVMLFFRRRVGVGLPALPKPACFTFLLILTASRNNHRKRFAAFAVDNSKP